MIRSKYDAIQDTIDLLFSKGSGRALQPSIEGLGAKPGFKPTRNRFEARADETTRMVREITNTATEQRQAKTAVLRAARLEREAEARAAVVPVPVKKAARSCKTAPVTPS